MCVVIFEASFDHNLVLRYQPLKSQVSYKNSVL